MEKTKYVVILGDGMADLPLDELGGKTPLEAANTPNMDYLACHGTLGIVKTVPDGMPPGSDVANLSVMGYDPKIYYTGRSPLEAISMEIDLDANDTAFRCNLVTLSNEKNYEQKKMLDYSAGEISTQEARQLIEDLASKLNNDYLHFYPGISYRHCLVWKNSNSRFELTPPHDILEKAVKDFLPKGNNSDTLLSLMQKSVSILSRHPVNLERIKNGKNPANSIWLWGSGKKPSLPSFSDKYNDIKAAVISAVDLIKGIGLCSNMIPINVEGATGNLNTNFESKAAAALAALDNFYDFVYLHIEAPDECAHQGQLEQKIRAIEYIDEKIVAPILDGLKKYMHYKILLLPDHPTPLSIRTHTSDPVPFIIYDSLNKQEKNNQIYTERSAQNTGIIINEGYKLMDLFIT